MMAYKTLGPGGLPCHGGVGAWPLPVDGQPGAWLHVSPPLEPCKRGLHVASRDHVVIWLGPELWEVEIEPGAVELVCDNTHVVSAARLVRRVVGWTERAAQAFAAACGRRALERAQAAGWEPSPQVWAMVEVTARASRGGASEAELVATAWAATWAATKAWIAARAVEGAAEEAAGEIAAWAAWAAVNATEGTVGETAALAAWAAGWAAEGAAGAVEGAAVRAAARAAERRWQTATLWEIIAKEEQET